MARRNRSRKTLQRWHQRARRLMLVVGLTVGTALVASFFFDEMGVRKYVAMRRHAEQLRAEIQELQRTNAELRKDLDRIEHDPARLEELARERLGFVRKGETVYQIVEEKDSK
ncbi:FtsB family cell division protein [Nitrospira sp. Kam-Ns4a]